MIERIKEIAATRVRYGYRRIHVLLCRDGWRVNVKRVYRVSGRDIAPSDWSSKQAQEQERFMTEACEENGSC